MLDFFGKAILDYQTNNNPSVIITETSISEADEMSISYLFRSYYEMPKLEQMALQLYKRKVLDVGCGNGSHSLFLQNERNIEVTAIDISEKAIKTCQLWGLKKAHVKNVLDLKNETFDTFILLMSGTGIFCTLVEMFKYLQKLKSLLNKGGQILLDSSDIIYMFDDDEAGGKWIPSVEYYGELNFTVSYKNEKEDSFPWLYLDYNTLQNAAHANGLQCELIIEGEHYDYLARLTL